MERGDTAAAPGGAARARRVAATREAILTAAERMFAEQGLANVSNRQISEAAGQGNNAAVGYHFGAKADLVRAIVRRHVEPVERLRVERLDAAGDSDDLRDWVECLVRPTADHLASLGTPTWFARFSAQVMTDPSMRPIVEEEALVSPSLHRATAGVDRCLADLPPAVRAERDAMVRQLLVLVPAGRELALASGTPVHRSTWAEAGTGLVDAVCGLYRAPVTPPDPAVQ